MWKPGTLASHGSSADVTEELSSILSQAQNRKGIIIYPIGIDWNIPMLQRPQQIALSMSSKNWLYFYCTSNTYDKVSGFHKMGKNLYLTDRYHELLDKLDSFAMVIPSAHPGFGIQDIIKLKEKAVIIYDYLDDIHPAIQGSVSVDKVLELRYKTHQYLIKNSDIVMVTADRLYNEAKRLRKDGVYLLPNGVDYGHFHLKRDPKQIPSEMQKIREKGKPIIGYFGALAVWFDYELLRRVACARPNLEFVLIGWNFDGSIYKSGILDIQYPNIHYLGVKDYAVLPKYAVWFDVCLLPFVLNDITHATSPIKLFEYMGLGKPTVSTALNEAKKYKSVLVANDHHEFAEKIDLALKLIHDNTYLETIEEEAKMNTWESRADELDKILYNTLAKKDRLSSEIGVANPVSSPKQNKADIICFPIIDWDYRHQRTQHFLARLARKGHRIFHLTSSLRPLGQDFAVKKIIDNVFEVQLNVPYITNVYKDIFEGEKLDFIFKSLNSAIKQLDIRDVISWVVFPTWTHMVIKLRELYDSKIIYDCLDAHVGFTDVNKIREEEEKLLIKESDLVITSSLYLYKHAQAIRNESILLLRNACEFQHFSALPPNQLVKVKKPIIGYIGAIRDWLDTELIEYLATAKKDCNFVFIGHVADGNKSGIERLRKLPNVHFLGEKIYHDLPKYIFHFDVCLIPFRQTALTDATNPVKFYEYLASGKPVVMTKMSDLDPVKELCYMAENYEDFLVKLDLALNEKDPQLKMNRIDFAKRNTWRHRMDVLYPYVERLGKFEPVSLVPNTEY